MVANSRSLWVRRLAFSSKTCQSNKPAITDRIQSGSAPTRCPWLGARASVRPCGSDIGLTPVHGLPAWREEEKGDQSLDANDSHEQHDPHPGRRRRALGRAIEREADKQQKEPPDAKDHG